MMSARVVTATAARVLAQLRRDPRTIALIVAVPLVLLTLLKFVFDDQVDNFTRIGPPLLGLFPFIVMFLITSISMLRERTTGTLERLMTLPLSKLDVLAGYGLAFGVMAAVQASATTAYTVLVLGLDLQGSAAGVLGVAVGNALLGMALGLFVSAFARTEFQAVQFMPALILPQLLLCGLFADRDGMAGVLRVAADALPLTYAYDALARVATDRGGAWLALDVAVLMGATALALAMGAATLRRRTS
jgi:ABC-2 type transport system permease protein